MTDVKSKETKKKNTNYVLTKIIDPLYELIPTYTGGKNDISFDEKYFYGCANSMIMKVDIETREIVDKIQHESEELANFALNPQGKTIVTFTKNYLLRYVNLENKEVIKFWRIQDYFPIDIKFENSGKFFAIGCVNGVIKIFDS